MKKKRFDTNKKLSYGEVTREVKSNYKAWLAFSNLDESELLHNRFLKPFVVEKEIDFSGAYRVFIGIKNVNGYKLIGEPFVSPSRNDNENFMVDLSLLLLYIAQRLDEANAKMPPIGFDVKDKEYFYSTVRTFLKQEGVKMN